MYILIVLDPFCHCPLCAINKNLITVIDDSLPLAFHFEGKGKVRSQATTAKKINLFLPMVNQCTPPLNCQARSNKEQIEFWSCKVWNWVYFILLNMKKETVLCCPKSESSFSLGYICWPVSLDYIACYVKQFVIWVPFLILYCLS